MCNEVDNLVDEPGVAGHKSEMMMSPAHVKRGGAFPSAYRVRETGRFCQLGCGFDTCQGYTSPKFAFQENGE